jgi:hypothetical protein
LLAVFAKRNVPEDQVTTYGVLATLTVVGLIQTFLVTLGFLLGTLLRRPMLAAVALVFIWLPVNLVLSTFELEQFSPLTMYQAVPSLLRTPWSVSEENQASSQTVEDAEALEAQAEQFMRLLSGQSPAPAATAAGRFLRAASVRESVGSSDPGRLRAARFGRAVVVAGGVQST